MEEHLWDLDIYCDGIRVGSIGGVSADSMNLLLLLDCINKTALENLDPNKPIAYTVKYADCWDWKRHIEITSDLDLLDMFISYRHKSKICLHLTYDTAVPLQVETPFKRAPITPISSPHGLFTSPPSSQQPHILSHSKSHHSTPQSNTCPQSPGCGPSQPSPRTPIPVLRLVDEDTNSSEGFSEYSDDDEARQRNPPGVTPDDETVRMRQGEDREYEREDDGIYGLSEEEEDCEWKASEEDGEDHGEASSELEDDDELTSDEMDNDVDELSDYDSDDNLGRQVSDDDLEEGCTKAYKSYEGKLPRMDSEGRIVLEIGQVYESVQHFRWTMKDYAIENGFAFCRVKNDPLRVTLECKGEGCPWRIHASRLMDGLTFKIKTFIDDHDCVRLDVNPEAKSTWIARKLKDLFRKDPKITLSAVATELKDRYGLENLCYKQLYRAKVRAIDELEGTHADSYGMLARYNGILMKTNPGSRLTIDYAGETREGFAKFKRVFMSVAGLKSGFINGCRPFIGLDGCHLKGPYKGCLLSAVGLDGNNGVYPIAWAVVETESVDTWKFFMEQLEDILDAALVDTKWCFMSDGQRGLDKVVQQFFPAAEHRRCAWHLFNNFRAKFPGVMLAKWFWVASRAYTEVDFQYAMRKIYGLNMLAHAWLLKLHPEQWSRHAFGKETKSDHVTNNHTESFNGWLGDLREKPITNMLDGIRKKLMVRTHQRFVSSEKWDGELCANIAKKLKLIQLEGRKCRVAAGSNMEFEVVDEMMKTFTVNLAKRVCICGSWELNGIPCKHACTCITYSRLKVNDFVDRCYFKDTFQRANGEYVVHPIPDPLFWPAATGVVPEAPDSKRGRGRPQLVRRRDRNLEAAATDGDHRSYGLVKCSKCGGLGHNARTCGRVPVHKMSSSEKRVFQESQSRTANAKKAKTNPLNPCKPQTQPTPRVTRSMRSMSQFGGIGRSSQP